MPPKKERTIKAIPLSRSGIPAGGIPAVPSRDITHEIIEETDHLPVFFSSPSRSDCDRCCCSADGCTVPVHWHNHLEFLYILEGHMTALIQADTYELEPGDLLVINSGELHMTRITGPTPYLILQISAKRLREFFPDLDLLHFTTHIRADEIQAVPMLYDSIRDMKQLFDEAEDGYQLLFTARLHEFLYGLYKNFSSWSVARPSASAGRDLKRITDVVEWTKENFRLPLTLDDAAGHLGISREYFCRIFKKYTGQTYLEFLCSIRTMNLYEEMQSSEENLSVLMEQNGLANYKTFIRTFKTLYGTTPQKARRGTA